MVATHADEALALLEDPSAEERRALGGFAYTVNDTVLHTDSSLLPRARAARASWNYRTGDDGQPTLTYYLNRLQGLESDRDYCVTLNQDVAEEHVLAAALLHPPALHRRHAARAGRAADGVGRAEHALCGRPSRERLPRGRARLRSRRRGRARGAPGEVGALHGDADALAANAAAERLPLPDLVLAARPGRAARARAPALAGPGQPPRARDLPRLRPLRRQRRQGGGDRLHRRPDRDAGADAHAAPRARLRLQPRVLLLVLPLVAVRDGGR